MTDDDHRELVDLALQWRGHCIISGYAHPIYKALERPEWYRIDTAISACSAAGRRTTKLSTRTETLWMNYDPAVVTGQRSLF
jgi:DNA adenine methylase